MQRFQFSFMSFTLFKVIASKPVEWPCGCWRCLFNFKWTCCIPFEQLIDDQTKVSMLEEQNKKSLYIIIRSRAFIRATHSLRGFLYNSLSAILGKKRDLKSPSNLLFGREYEVQGKTNLTINLTFELNSSMNLQDNGWFFLKTFCRYLSKKSNNAGFQCINHCGHVAINLKN